MAYVMAHSYVALLAALSTASIRAVPTVSTLWSFQGPNGAPTNLVSHDGRSTVPPAAAVSTAPAQFFS
jgi:hypothetical protein